MSEPLATEAELERFRQQWKEEVSTRGKAGPSSAARSQTQSSTIDRRKAIQATGPSASSRLPEAHDESAGPTFHDLPDKEDALKLGAADKGLIRPTSSTEPVTALEHYEQAVDNETAGKLGESLKLYRKAFRLDDNVHEKYKNKHFPPSAFASKKPQPNPSNASATVPNPAHHSLHGLPPTVTQLIEEFATLAIPGAEPPTDASPAPPCPISELPEEIVTQILYHVGRMNIGAFSRLALVCKKFAYLIMTEEQIWKAVTLSNDQGFGNMHYKFARDVFGKPLPEEPEHILGSSETTDMDEPLPEVVPTPSFLDISHHLLAFSYASSWRQMFRARPRVRFHGVYISTVNYTRPGGASSTINTWSTPVHVVTYYRYLRFYRDGTCISLLTTAEPVDVVHIISKENLSEQTSDPRQTRRNAHLVAQQSKPPPTSLDKSGSSHAQAAKTDHAPALPSSQIMKDALRGRWRLSGPGDGTFPLPPPDAGPDHVQEAEGDLHVETEGVVPRYTYKMQFAIGSGSVSSSATAAAQAGQTGGGKKGSRGMRLGWKGFWSYNRLTDDWGEFGLKNDRAFYFSRVRSYGMGV
ncbi:F-box-like domain-containing protein 3 [Elsinoe fawcettii]|nr:F-box-like domain-containing protein 3 [Elsinoe fawcettii]